jgi:GT2 family glycosyltransferase
VDDDNIDLLSWGEPPSWTLGTVVTLDDPDRAGNGVGSVADVVDRHLAGSGARWLLWWHPLLGAPPIEAIRATIAGSPLDACHGGLALGSGNLPDEHDYIHPSTPFVLDPAPDVEGTCWRLSLGAALFRTDALRTIGGIDRAFHGTTGAGLELGHRLLEAGGIVRSAPWLVPETGLLPGAFDEHDRFLLLRRLFGRKWVDYAAVRRCLASRRMLRTYQGWRSSGRTAAAIARPAAGLVERAPVAMPADPTVSVVLPTLGRYDLLRPLLGQLVEQTIAPVEILVVDQNEPDKRDPDLYAEFEDRGVHVIWQEERGQWISRNAAIQRSKGEWIAFVDDDSEVGPDFLAAHLEGLTRYQAALSTGASLAVVGAPVPDNYRFFRVADQWDSGNGMCRRTLFGEMGLFDQQFDRQRRGDAEFGLRVQLSGGLVLHNPDARRIHLKAESGGLRSYGSWDGFRHRDRSGPLPLPSMLYYTARYHSRRQQREDLFLGVVNGFVPYHLKRRASPALWVRLLVVEAWHLRSTIRRVRWSRRVAADMVADGPRIPALAQ